MPRVVLSSGLAALTLAAAVTAGAQQRLPYDDAADAARALAAARAEGAAAGLRAERLERAASLATEQAERTARQAAALAARIQQGEAQIAALEVRARLIARERTALRARLAAKQQPLVRLTAALQRLSRRPPVLALLRPGSVRDTMYLRALLATLVPQVERRTAALRIELERARLLQDRAARAARALRAGAAQLQVHRQNLAAMESRQRLASRQANSVADREAERALAMAEQAGDLGALVRDLAQAGQLRRQLAMLPGPVLRPATPGEVMAEPVPVAGPSTPVLAGYMLPVRGRLVSGFGTINNDARSARGITLVARPGAQVVAPGGGRIVFAGPFRGYGRIVIIEHDGGWTSLVTGMTGLDARVADKVVAGSPLGTVGPGTATVTLELRRDGIPVNPLQFIRIS